VAPCRSLLVAPVVGEVGNSWAWTG